MKMKKLYLLLFLVPSLFLVSCMGSGSIARGVSVDKVEGDGQRTVLSMSNNLYTEWNSAAAFRLACFVSSKRDTTFVLMLTLNEGKMQIDEGRKLLIKFDDNSIMELSNITRIGPADYEYRVTKYGTDYYVQPAYAITEKQIHELMTKKAVKVRIEHDIDQIDRELSDLNKLGKGITAAYESIKEALGKSKNIYSDF